LARHFQLWDTSTGNLISTFATEAEALAVVQAAVRDDGAGAVAAWALGWEDDRGRGRQVAAGQGLADRAINALTA
jgi:hypothetical protein